MCRVRVSVLLPEAAVINAYKLGGLKQHKVILSPNWRTESRIKLLAGLRRKRTSWPPSERTGAVGGAMLGFTVPSVRGGVPMRTWTGRM